VGIRCAKENCGNFSGQKSEISRGENTIFCPLEFGAADLVFPERITRRMTRRRRCAHRDFGVAVVALVVVIATKYAHHVAGGELPIRGDLNDAAAYADADEMPPRGHDAAGPLSDEFSDS
jgi:hypothetical protein